MTLVIEAFELDKKTNIAYSHREEVIVTNASVRAKVERATDRCLREVRRKQEAAKEFEKSVPKGERMKDKKVKCSKCGVELGYQGLSRHMWFKHSVGKRYTNMHQKKVVPREHPVEDLERTISRLVQQETALRDQLDQMTEVQNELQSVSQLRESLEKLVETYRQRKEVLTGVAS